ncbi:MAG: hypothetical protein CMN32_02455 [Saprospirales bacterium]|nr:hypothetical protein [Saprospirales bacterium]
MIRKHSLYFFLFALFIVAGGIYTAMSGKTDALFYFNENRQPFWDVFFRFATKLGEGYVYIIAALVALFYRLRYFLLIAAGGLMVMLVSVVTKSYFAVDRPLAMLRKEGLENLLNPVADVTLHTGATSFPSGHAMSALCFYTLILLILPPRRWLDALFFLLAMVVVISRVYLFQHFWQDVYAGAITGFALAVLLYALQQKLTGPRFSWLDHPVFNRKTGWVGNGSRE